MAEYTVSDFRTWEKKMLCKILGHKFDPAAAEYYYLFHCERCGQEVEGSVSLFEQISWRIRMRFRGYLRPHISWLKCDQCGWHFGRHDPENDHLPF